MFSDERMQNTYLTDGATIKPMNTRRIATTGCDGGISKMCFKKNVLSSVICQKITNWDTDTNRIYVEFGFNHRTVVQLTGVNCKTARFILPVVVEISRMLAHLYSRISSILQILKPHQIPRPLQIKTSKINASHQHSTKFGKRWANVISVISHITEIAHRIPTWRIRIAYRFEEREMSVTRLLITWKRDKKSENRKFSFEDKWKFS